MRPERNACSQFALYPSAMPESISMPTMPKEVVIFQLALRARASLGDIIEE